MAIDYVYFYSIEFAKRIIRYLSTSLIHSSIFLFNGTTSPINYITFLLADRWVNSTAELTQGL